jgi:hypothetical protein
MKIVISIIILMILFSETRSQQWEKNYVTEYCEKNNIVCMDIANTGDIIWILDIKGFLYEFRDQGVKRYFTNFKNGTKLKSYEISNDLKDDDFNYSKLIANEKVVWLIDYSRFRFIKIENDFITEFLLMKTNFIDHYFDDAKIDNRGNLYFILNYFNSSKYLSKFFKIGSSLQEISSEKTSGVHIKCFELLDEKIYLIKDFPLEILVLNNNDYSVEKEIPLDSNLYRNNVKSYTSTIDKSVYFLFNKGDMIRYSNDSLNFVNLHLENLLDCYWFLPFNKYIFLSYSGGFFIYNKTNDKLIKQSLEYEGERYVVYKNLSLFNNQILGSYGIVNPTNCNVFSTGIGIFSLRGFKQ